MSEKIREWCMFTKRNGWVKSIFVTWEKIKYWFINIRFWLKNFSISRSLMPKPCIESQDAPRDSLLKLVRPQGYSLFLLLVSYSHRARSILRLRSNWIKWLNSVIDQIVKFFVVLEWKKHNLKHRKISQGHNTKNQNINIRLVNKHS